MILNKLSEIINNHNINLSEEDILNFLKCKKRWPLFYYQSNQPSVEIINNLGYNSNKNFFDADYFINFEKWKKIYDLGFTSILSNILDLNDDLRNLNNLIYYNLGNTINGNFYINKGNNINIVPSFLEHDHPYDVIVKQIQGECLWKINNKEIILRKNNVLVIPRNTKHQVIKNNGFKLSLTLNII